MHQLKSELSQTTHKAVKTISPSILEALANFDQQPDSAYIRLPVVQRLYGVSGSTIWRGVNIGIYPKPKQLSVRCTGWNVGLVRADLAAKASV